MLCGSVEGEENCPVEDMKCINDDAELEKGYWWEQESEESKSLCKSFTENVINMTNTYSMRAQQTTKGTYQGHMTALTKSAVLVDQIQNVQKVMKVLCAPFAAHINVL